MADNAVLIDRTLPCKMPEWTPPAVKMPVYIGHADDGRRRSPREQSGDIDPCRINAAKHDGVAGEADDNRRLPAAPLMRRIVPIPAAGKARIL
jgi:hypothetical protein